MNRTLRTVFIMISAGFLSLSLGKAESLKANHNNSVIVAEGASFDFQQGGTEDINNVTFYPNPVKDNLTVRFPKKGNFSVTIYNIIGDKVLTRTVMDDNEIHLDVSQLQNGLYFISYEYDGKVLTKRFSKIL